MRFVTHTLTEQQRKASDMTTPQIEIPADVMARVADTHARKTAEAERQMQLAADHESATDSTHIVRWVTLNTADDVTDEVLLAAIQVFEMWFDHDDERIDWDSFWDRLNKFGFDVMKADSSAARKIQRAVRDHRKAGE